MIADPSGAQEIEEGLRTAKAVRRSMVMRRKALGKEVGKMPIRESCEGDYHHE